MTVGTPLTWNRLGLEVAGFSGFEAFSDLRIPRNLVLPSRPGVYVVLRQADSRPVFTEGSPARGTPYSVAELRSRWVEGVSVLYIGKADSRPGGIHKRVKQFARRGNSHQGGRAICQLAESDELLVAWGETEGETGRQVDVRLLEAFIRTHGRRPFAKLDD